jgi:hypothetical protein
MRKRSSNNLLPFVGLFIVIIIIYVVYMKSTNPLLSDKMSNTNTNNLQGQCKDCKVDVDMSSLS